MSPFDLIRSRTDGSLSLTKLAATTFHLQIAVVAGWLTWSKGDFNETLWLLYAGVAVGHAVVDKGAALMHDSKLRSIAAAGGAGGDPVTTGSMPLGTR